MSEGGGREADGLAAAVGPSVVDNRRRQSARVLPTLAPTHLEHREAFGNQDVACQSGQLVYLTLLKGGGIDPVDGALNGTNDSDLHLRWRTNSPCARSIDANVVPFGRNQWPRACLVRRRLYSSGG